MVRTLTRGSLAGGLTLALALIAALLFAALSSGTLHAQEPETTAEPVLISVEPPIEPGSIRVTGSASLSVDNDAAVVNISVAATRDRAINAIIDVNASVDDVLTALTDVGITSDDLRTTGLSLHAEYDFSNGTRTLRGFRFTNSLQITVNDIDQVGEVLDAVFVAGGDLLSLNFVSFIVSDRLAAEADVRLAAVDDAVAKATAITERLGLTLGRAISIQEAGFFSPRPVEFLAIEADAGFAAPAVFGGTQEVTVRIDIVFETWPAPVVAE